MQAPAHLEYSSATNGVKKEALTKTRSIASFKGLFLGVLASLALSRAVVDFSQHVLQMERFYVFELSDITSFIKNTSVLSWLVLLYFILNLIRYYVSTFIFDFFAFSSNVSPGALLNEALPEQDGINSEALTEIKKLAESKTAKWQRTTIFLTIIDLVFSCLLIFLMGVAGTTIAHFGGFAFMSVLILILDIMQTIYQWRMYVPRKTGIYDNFLEEVGNKLKSTSGYQEIGMRLLGDRAKVKNQSADYKKILRSWILVDCVEILVWTAAIYFWSWSSPKGTIMSCVLVAVGLFGCYIGDLYVNAGMWSNMLGINSEINRYDA